MLRIPPRAALRELVMGCKRFTGGQRWLLAAVQRCPLCAGCVLLTSLSPRSCGPKDRVAPRAPALDALTTSPLTSYQSPTVALVVCGRVSTMTVDARWGFVPRLTVRRRTAGRIQSRSPFVALTVASSRSLARLWAAPVQVAECRVRRQPTWGCDEPPLEHLGRISSLRFRSRALTRYNTLGRTLARDRKRHGICCSSARKSTESLTFPVTLQLSHATRSRTKHAVDKAHKAIISLL